MKQSILVSSIEGNRQKLDGGSMFGNAPKAVWEKWCPVDHLGRIDLACRSLFVEIGDIKILCDTGIGAFFEPKLAERYGVQEPNTHLLLDSLLKRGITEDQINYVILSHLHFDHAGGLLSPYSPKGPSHLLFKNAKYIVGKTAWQRAKKPHARDRASFIPEIISLLDSSNRLLVIDNKDDLPTDIKDHFDFFISDGHTPGQLLSTVLGKDRNITFTGDLVAGSPWVHLPITMGYDRYAEMVIDEKQDLYNQLRAERDILFFTHDANISAATYKKDEKSRYSTATSWQTLDRLEL